MKKLLGTVILIGLTISLFGQFGKGKTMIGGEGAFVNVSFGQFNSSGLILTPSYGYGISDGLFLGSDLLLTTGGGTAFGLTPFLRKYFTQSGKGGFYGELSGGFVTSNGSTIGTLNPSAGYSILAGSNFVIDLGLQYERNLTNGFDVLSVGFGFRGLLGGNQQSSTQGPGN